MDACLLSVVVPLAPVEECWSALAGQLAALPAGSEVILVRSDTRTRTRPQSWPDTLSFVECFSAAGRARQMNTGSQRARGRWLWFLHADSQLLPATLPALVHFIGREDAVLGWFDLVFHDGPWLTRLNAWGANARARLLRLPFGDQGFVLPARSFEALGGYDERTPYGEDHLLVWRARADGLALARIGAPLATSARKYATYGWLTTTLRHLRLTSLQAWNAWRNLRRRHA